MAWSPSGRYIAIGQQGLFWTSEGEVVLVANGEFSHGMVQGSAGKWSWSPIADCGIAIEVDSDGALQANHIDPDVAANVRLINRGIESFAFSRDGRRLGLELKEGPVRSIWIADLERNRMQEVRRFERATCCITFAGWSPHDRDLLYWAAPGASVAADGWPLEGVSLVGRRSEYAAMITSPSYLATCAGGLLAVIGGGRGQLPEYARRRLAYVRPGQASPLTRRSVVTQWPACAPNGDLIAAVESRDTTASGRLVILDEAGRQVEGFSVEGVEFPDWGPSGTGILFTQRPTSGPCQMWFVPEGAGPRPIGLSVPCRRVQLPRMYDWSATPPDGLPTG